MKLQIKDDTGKTHSVPLTRDEITIGRKEGNTIRLTERNVSRTHARFLRKGEEIHVEDLSRYGTRVNGERITETRRVGSGDVIQIGDYLISLEGVKPVDENAVADQKLQAAAAAVAPAKAAAAAPAKDAKKEDKSGKPAIPEGYAMKTMPDGSISADDVRKSLGAGKKRIGANHPTLVAVSTHLAGQEFPITGGTMVLGRTGENDIKIDHQSISSNHAKVVVADGRVKMVDLKSKNGIRVNGEYWEESTLKSGDIIELGKVQFRFVDKGEEFVYRPEDYAGGAKPGGAKAAAVAPIVEEKKGSKAWVVIVLLLAAGAAVGIYLATKGPGKTDPPQPTSVAKPTDPPTKPTETAVTVPAEADAGATATAAQADTAQAATTAAEADVAVAQPEVMDQNAVAKAELLKKATDSVKAQKWDEAKGALDGLLALDPANEEGKKLLAMVEAERSANASFEEYQAAQAKNDLPVAWAALEKLKDLPPESGYYARVQEARAAVGPALANFYADQAQTAFNRKAWAEAIARGEDAKKITFNHARADEIIAKARKKQREERENKPDPVKPDPVKPDPSGKTGKDLYNEGRELHNSNPSGALKLYEQAAGKGYASAYKQIGSIKVKLGDTGGAITAYKRYLSLVPSANDADMVKDIIVRLGGTP